MTDYYMIDMISDITDVYMHVCVVYMSHIFVEETPQSQQVNRAPISLLFITRYGFHEPLFKWTPSWPLGALPNVPYGVWSGW